ncbi:MAG: hypothetical protein JST04_06890 [Bdellovibrionales bacterium]|nr:hypothetical protein [Bdellovibrionales bacterium]
MKKFGRFRTFAFSLLALGVFAGPRDARAWPYYFEFGGGYAAFTSPNSLLVSQGKASSSSAGSGYDLPLTFAVQLQEHSHGLLFALGLQTRYLNGTSGAGDAFSVVPVSPILRLEFWRIVLGAGYTTWMTSGLNTTKISTLDSMLTLEAQFLFPITPEIDFGLQASRESFSSVTYGNSASVMEYGAFFRLNFGYSENALSERKKFKGWRYPFGSPLR